MKTLVILILMTITMKTCSQNTPVPPTPPTPPTANASMTNSGITYAKSDNGMSYAFSCNFNEELKDDILRILKKELKEYSNDYYNQKFIKEIEDEYSLKVELKSTELKLEYRLENASIEDKKYIKDSFNKIEKSILSIN